MYSLFVFPTALLLSILTIAVTKPIAIRIGLVDKPGGHKLHEVHTPLVGGIAIYLSVALAWFLVPRLGLGSLNSVFVAAGGLLFTVGLLDDRFQLTVKLRFVAQGLAALLLVFSNVVLRDVGELLPGEIITLGVFAIPLTVFATVGAINALNMIDGVDGLAGSVSFTSFALLFVAAFVTADERHAVAILCVLGGIAGFLAFNMPIKGRARAHIFMGDAGSTLLGFLLAFLLITMSQGSERAMSPVTALWIFAVPLIDTLGVMLRRVWLKQSPFISDRGHIHHLLMNAGFRVRQAVLLIAGLQLLLGAAGLTAFYLSVPDLVSLLAFLLVFAGYAFMVIRPWRIVPKFRDLHGRSGLTIAGVQHIYVGNLRRESAEADMKALLGAVGRGYSCEIYQLGESGAGKSETYALVNAGTTDGVKALLTLLRANQALLGSQRGATSEEHAPVIRQFVPRKAENDRRHAGPKAGEFERQRRERRAGIARLVYHFVAEEVVPGGVKQRTGITEAMPVGRGTNKKRRTSQLLPDAGFRATGGSLPSGFASSPGKLGKIVSGVRLIIRKLVYNSRN